MNTLDLAALQKITTQAQKLQKLATELMPFLELVKELNGKDFCIPTDRLIRTSDAAKILGVSKAAISTFVNAGLLTPLYVNSEQRRFW